MATSSAAKAWKDGNPEPGSFLFSVTDTTFMTGRLGVRSIAAAGNTNIPYNVLVDDYQMLSGSWTNPPVVSHTTWVRKLAQAFDGNFTDVIEDLVSTWSIDTSDDALAYAMKFEAYTPAVIDPILGYQVFGQSAMARSLTTVRASRPLTSTTTSVCAGRSPTGSPESSLTARSPRP